MPRSPQLLIAQRRASPYAAAGQTGPLHVLMASPRLRVTQALERDVANLMTAAKAITLTMNGFHEHAARAVALKAAAGDTAGARPLRPAALRRRAPASRPACAA